MRILTEPDASLTAQYRALLATEGVTVSFAADGVRRLAEIAHHVNERTENIGARRLHTVMEKLLESVSYDATSSERRDVSVDGAYVDGHPRGSGEGRGPESLHPLSFAQSREEGEPRTARLTFLTQRTRLIETSRLQATAPFRLRFALFAAA